MTDETIDRENRIATASASGSLKIQAVAAFASSIALLTAGLFVGANYFGWVAPLAAIAEGSTLLMLLYSGVLLLIILGLALRGLKWHPHSRYGAANCITTARASGTALVAAIIPIASPLNVQLSADVLDTQILFAEYALWLITVFIVVLLILDGLDGYLARRSALMSQFGARFDMEVDALLILVISVLIWQSGEVGIWIVSLGLMRYFFVAASLVYQPLAAELYPSLRRKTVCVIQLVVLCAIVSPVIHAPLSGVLGVIGLICLIASFARDIRWLCQQASPQSPGNGTE